MLVSTGLARVTISAPQRRVDVALPERVPLAELLPDVLRQAGEDLADQGENHGGWVLRRADGAALATGQGLSVQGVRDGEVLHLVPAHDEWPEIEYDDVVEAVAEGARRRGGLWSPAATRDATLAAAMAPLALGLLALFLAGPGRCAAGLGAAAPLLLAGTIFCRGYGHARTGAAVAGAALPYAFAGGAGLDASGWDALTGSAALLGASAIGAIGVPAGMRIFAAGATAGLLATLTALLASVSSAAAAAAALTSVLVCGLGALPVLAVRLGRTPLPSLALPGRADAAGDDPPDRAVVFAAVDRTDEILTGMLLGHAALAVAGFVLLATEATLAARVLIAAASTALLLRARLFVTVRLRAPLLAAGTAGLAALGAGLLLAADRGAMRLPVLLATVLLIASLTILSGTRYASRPPSPYLSRAADLLEGLAVIAVIPVACAVAGLYTALSGLP